MRAGIPACFKGSYLTGMLLPMKSLLFLCSHVWERHTPSPWEAEGGLPGAVGEIEGDLISWAGISILRLTGMQDSQQGPCPSETHTNTQARDSSWENLMQ